MKLLYYDLNLEFELHHDKVNQLVIENPEELEKFVIALSRRLAKNGESVELYEDLDKLDIAKLSNLISSPMDLVYDKKEVQKKLYETLMQEMELSSLSEEFAALSSKFLSNLDELQLYSEYDLDFDSEFNHVSLLKSFDVHLKNPEGFFVEKLIDYSKNIHRLLGKKLFILLSCSQYLKASDFEYLLEHAKNEEVTFLFIESGQLYLNSDKNELIIDIDLCEIR
ncbi:MAG: type II-A CRISPR-associated protein Csn2 [Bacillota bacterium]|nr:type II-A CRISPR-associated protein Csn2 [Bacillota bacterium]